MRKQTIYKAQQRQHKQTVRRWQKLGHLLKELIITEEQENLHSSKMFYKFASIKFRAMEIRIFSAREYNAKLKCTIHSSGKLGFTDETAKELGLSVESGIKFAMNDKDELLLINCRLDKDEDAFDVGKSGTYYYVNAKPLFDSLGLDYKNNVIMFDLSKLKHDTLEIYKLNQRSKPRKAESDKKQ